MKHLQSLSWLAISVALAGLAFLPSLTLAAPVSIQNETSKLVTFNEDKLLDATVNLYCRVKVGNKEVSTTGTGVIIDSRGIILTNAHVAQYFLLNGEDTKLKTECSVRVGSPAKEKYQAEVLYISKEWLKDNAKKSVKSLSKGTGENDFALLRIKAAKNGKLPAQFSAMSWNSAAQVKKGDAVTVAGYPTGSLKYKEVKNKLEVRTASTTVTGLQTFAANTIDLMTLSRSILASSGVSGGPVVSSTGLAGIVVTRSTSKSKEGASLRAIIMGYIDRAITKETGFPLNFIYTTDLAQLAAKTKADISKDTLSAIERPLRTLR